MKGSTYVSKLSSGTRALGGEAVEAIVNLDLLTRFAYFGVANNANKLEVMTSEKLLCHLHE